MATTLYQMILGKNIRVATPDLAIQATLAALGPDWLVLQRQSPQPAATSSHPDTANSDPLSVEHATPEVYMYSVP